MMKATSVASALAHCADSVGLSLLGRPTCTSCREMRWGRRGSRCLTLVGEKRGLWFDHERGVGGDMLDLIADVRGTGRGEAIRIAEKEFVTGVPRRPRPLSAVASPSEDEAKAKRITLALQIWREASPLSGTLGEQYLNEQRHLNTRALGDLSHALRWHNGVGAIVALMTEPLTASPVGIHRTFLDGYGRKLERKMLGRQGLIRLSDDVDVTIGLGIVEGIEDGLAVVLGGWGPVWVTTSAGAVARFPVIEGIEALTVFADADNAGLEAARTCVGRWLHEGREALCSPPPERGANHE